jgi:WD40 repeat protein
MNGRLVLVACLVFALGRFGRSEPPPADDPAPKTDKPPAVDRYGDPLPPGTLARMGTIRFRHGGPVFFAGFSADGKTLVSAGQEQAVRFWELATGKELRQILVEGQMFSGVALSADGKTLATASDNQTIQVWDVATGKALRKLALPQLGIVNFALSADGKGLVFLANDQTVRFWMTTSDKEPHELVKFAPPVAGQPPFGPNSLALSGDGQTLAVGGVQGMAGVVRLWNVPARRELPQLSGPQNGAISLVFSPDGKILAVGEGSQQTIRLYELATGKELRQLSGGQNQTYAPAFSPDGKIVAGVSNNSSIHLWETATGKEIRQMAALNYGIMAIAFSPDGQTLASGGASNRAHLWDVATGKERQLLGGHQMGVTGVALAPDGQTLATASLDQTVRLWEIATGKELRQFRRPKPEADLGGLENLAPCLAFCANGKILGAVYADGVICLWDPGTGKELRHFAASVGNVTAMAFAPNGKALAVGGTEGPVRLWDPATGKEIRQLKTLMPATPPGVPPEGLLPVTASLAFSPDGKTLAVGGPTAEPDPSGNPHSSIRLWEVATAQIRGQIKVPEPFLGGGPAGPGIAFGGLIGVAGALGGVGGNLGGDGWPVTSLAFAPHGKSLAFGQGDTIYLWDLARRREMRRFGGDKVTANAIAFSPDGKTLAAGSQDGQIHLWGVDTGTALCVVEGHRGGVASVAFSADGKLLASGGIDTTALIWDVKSLPDDSKRRPGSLSSQKLQALWNDLGSTEATRAYDAIWALAAAPTPTTTFLQEHLRPVALGDAQQIARLVSDLDSERYERRKNATEALERLGDVAEPALRKLLVGKPSLEMRQRAEQLLQKLEQPVTDPDRLRTLRAIEVLGHINTPEARQVLRKLAEGAPESRLTQQAQETLDRQSRE